MLNRIKEILSAQFIFTDDIVEILAVALTAKKNCILWGPGGHGHSAMKTEGALRKGVQVFPMRTECIIGLTNREPAELAEMGPAAAALVERFPLQLRVTWPSYAASDYA